MLASRTDHMNTFVKECDEQQRAADIINKYLFGSTQWVACQDKLVFKPASTTQLYEMLATTIHVEHANTNVYFNVASATINHWFDKPGVYVVSCVPRRLDCNMSMFAKTSKPCRIVSHHIDWLRHLSLPTQLPSLYKMYTTQHRYEFQDSSKAVGFPGYTSNLVTLEVECASMVSCKLMMTPCLPMGMFGAKIDRSILVGEQTAKVDAHSKTGSVRLVRFDVGSAFCNVDELSIVIVHQGQPASMTVLSTNVNFLNCSVEHADMVHQTFCY